MLCCGFATDFLNFLWILMQIHSESKNIHEFQQIFLISCGFLMKMHSETKKIHKLRFYKNRNLHYGLGEWSLVVHFTVFYSIVLYFIIFDALVQLECILIVHFTVFCCILVYLTSWSRTRSGTRGSSRSTTCSTCSNPWTAFRISDLCLDV